MNMNSKLRMVLRTTLGLFLILYALNKFLHIVPEGFGDMNENARDFIDGVAVYLPFLYIFEIIIGLFLILNKWTAFILIVLFPLSFSFLIFSFSNGDLVELVPAIIVAALNIILLIGHKEKYKYLFE